MRKSLSAINLAFAALIITYAIWFLVSPEYRPFIVGYGTLFGSLTLVLVTLNYTVAAIELWKETRRDRETRWIEHRLQDLYQPIKNLMHDSGVLHTNWRTIREKLYLDDGILAEKLDEFSNVSGGKGDKEHIRIHKEITDYVSAKTDDLVKRLHELHRGQS